MDGDPFHEALSARLRVGVTAPVSAAPRPFSRLSRGGVIAQTGGGALSIACVRLLQRPRGLEHGNELAVLLQGHQAWAVVAAPDALARDEDVGDARPSGALRELGPEGLALVSHVVQLQRRVLHPHVDQDLLGLFTERSCGETEHDDLGPVDDLLELLLGRFHVVVAGLGLGEGAAPAAPREISRG